MMPSRVLITGAGGFIGQHLVRYQLEQGRTVRALDQNTESLRDVAQREGLEVMMGDVADVGVQRKAVAGVDLVFHLASAHLEIGLPDAVYQQINVTAVRTLLEESRSAGVQRFVHVSSCGVHGQVQNPPANEEAPFRPDIVYERTKLAGELVARDFHRRYGFPVVVVRPAWVYGPGCKRTARLFRSIADRKFFMIGPGLNLRSAVYITDLLDALERCATCEGIGGEIFIMAHDECVTVSQIVNEVARLVGTPPPRLQIPIWFAWVGAALIEILARGFRKQPPISRRSLKFFTNNAGFTCAKARQMLGFHPQVPLRTGLELTYQWWRENGGG
jgi:nucleoside-diphosphate-sugar epimerase